VGIWGDGWDLFELRLHSIECTDPAEIDFYKLRLFATQRRLSLPDLDAGDFHHRQRHG